MFERFTKPAREAVLRARAAAGELRHPYIDTEHLLLGLLEADAGLAYAVLHDAGVRREQVHAEIVRLAGTGPQRLGDLDAAALQSIGIDLEAVRSAVKDRFGPGALDLPPEAGRHRGERGRFSTRGKKVLELALREAIRLRHHYIGPEHILLGLIREGNGLAAKILTEAGLSLDELRRRTLTALGRAA